MLIIIRICTCIILLFKFDDSREQLFLDKPIDIIGGMEYCALPSMHMGAVVSRQELDLGLGIQICPLLISEAVPHCDSAQFISYPA